jgi:hypothetical protein
MINKNSVTVVTTLHKDGYDLYGQENLESWATFFPEAWKITYYKEKHDPILPSRVEIVDFDQQCASWQNYFSAVKLKLAQEKNPEDEKRRNWYKKALRWSFKMYTVLHAMKNCNSKYLIWLDADVKAVTSPSHEWIEKCLLDKSLAAQLEMIKAGGHIETGILIFDLEHADSQTIYNWIYDGYVNFKILDEEKAWDGIWMAKLLMTDTVAWNKLTMVTKNKSTMGTKRSQAVAFSNNDLKWLVHRVGKRKFNQSQLSSRSGRSSDNELI